MTKWKDPKNNYVASDEVTPEIFNELATNECYLKEVNCIVEIKSKSDLNNQILNGIVFVEN